MASLCSDSNTASNSETRMQNTVLVTAAPSEAGVPISAPLNTSVESCDGKNHVFEGYGPKIGAGGFGRVIKLKCTSCLSNFARKDVLLKGAIDSYTREKHLSFMDREIEFLQTLQHPHVLNYVHHLRVDHKELQIYTEFCEYGDLETRTDQKLSEEFAWHVCEAISSALAKCHHGLNAEWSKSTGVQYLGFENNWTPVLHRDIKPGNILLSAAPGQSARQIKHHHGGTWLDHYLVKLGDFGTACRIERDVPRSTIGGTRAFFAPELEAECAGGQITKWSPASDVWSLGVTLYRLLTRQFPIAVSSLSRFSDRYHFVKEKLGVSDALVRVICECLDHEPENRPTALDLLSISLKMDELPAALDRSKSFWLAMARYSQETDGALIARTTRKFTADYLCLLNPTFLPEEICLLMSMQALHNPRSMLTLAQRLMNAKVCDSSASTILHTVALMTTREPYIKSLCWEISKWPYNPSLRQFSLRENNEGILPSMLAALQGDKITSKFLYDIEKVARSANVEGQLEEASKRSRIEAEAHVHEEVEFLYQLLTENGARSWTMKRSSTALAFSVAAAKGYTTILGKLIDSGVDVSAKSGAQKETALHLAAASGKADIVKFLLEKGAFVDCLDYLQRSPLHYAAWKGHAEIVSLLIDKGISINSQDSQNRTALYGAAAKGFAQVVQVLVKRGADVGLRGGSSQETPLEKAIRNGYDSVAKLLRGGPQSSPGARHIGSMATPSFA